MLNGDRQLGAVNEGGKLRGTDKNAGITIFKIELQW